MGKPVQHSLFSNAILKGLPSSSLEQLSLSGVRLAVGEPIVRPDSLLRSILFVEAGCVALVTRLADGSLTETALLGNRSAVGCVALVGQQKSSQGIAVRSPGYGYLSPIEKAREEFAKNSLFHDLALDSLRTELMQTAQLAVCNRRHDVEQRISRWLLHCNMESGTPGISVPQEGLSVALGVMRTSVGVVIESLRSRGLITSSLGEIRVSDQSGLENCACECYKALRALRAEEGRDRACETRARGTVVDFGHGIRSISPGDRRRQDRERSGDHVQ